MSDYVVRHEQPLEFDASWCSDRRAPVIWMEGEVAEKPIRLLVDTGSQVTMLNAQTLNDRGVALAPLTLTADFSFMGHEAERYETDLEFLEIGPYRIGGTPVWAAEFPAELTALHVEGIVGMDLLSELNAMISFPGKSVAFHIGGEVLPPSVHQIASGWERDWLEREAVHLLVEREAGRITRGFVDVMLDGRPLRLMIDTGSRHTLLNTESPAVQRVVSGRHLAGSREVGDTLYSLRGASHAVQLGTIQVPVEKMWLTNLGETAGRSVIPYDGVLGTELLVDLRAMLDLHEGRLELVNVWPRGDGAVVTR